MNDEKQYAGLGVNWRRRCQENWTRYHYQCDKINFGPETQAKMEKLPRKAVVIMYKASRPSGDKTCKIPKSLLSSRCTSYFVLITWT